MNKNKKIGLVGILIAVAYMTYAIYISVGRTGEIIDELMVQVPISLILLLPSLLLYFIEDFKKNISWLGMLYVGVLSLGIINLFFVNDPLAAGLPMVVVVLPLAIITSITFLVLKK